ncbi:MAG TPA: hypothetical protein VIH27_03735 [Nitrososphaerales archaeon]
MDWRETLLKVEEIAEENSVTSSTVAMHMGVKKEEASLAMMRLHQMGFLKRKKKVRRCHDRSYINYYNRGYEYRYSLSRQGISYLQWYRNGRASKQLTETVYFNNIYNKLPRDIALQLALLGLAGKNSRFKRSSTLFKHIDLTPFPTVHYLSTMIENIKFRQERDGTVRGIRDLLLQGLNRERVLSMTTAEREGYLALYMFAATIIGILLRNDEKKLARFSHGFGELERMLVESPKRKAEERFNTLIPIAEEAFNMVTAKLQ